LATVLERGQLKKELYTFLILTFAATYILDFTFYFLAGPITESPNKLWYIGIPFAMFIPALVAIFCMVYFKSGALTKNTKIIFSFFLVYLVAAVLGIIFSTTIFSIIVAVIGMLTIIILNLKDKWRKELVASKLSFGRNLKYYILIPAIYSAILILSFVLSFFYGSAIPTIGFNLYLFFATLLPTLLIGFFINWPSFFGEEYGWRVYLQDRLFPLLGSYRGVLLLGVIWGLWHTPIILFGYNYPGQPILGNILMILFTVVNGIIFSYAVLKTGSVWIAVILHLIVDTMTPFAVLYISNSTNPLLSFGMGLYGIALLAVFAVILLKSNVWKNYDESIRMS
jgi:uncharacterized protein